MSEYKKYCYWVDFRGLKAVRKHLEKKEVELREETRIPCRVLRTSMEVGYVMPLAWEGFCKRRTSWYLSSEKAGKFLVVSNGQLNHSGLDSPILIVSSDFRPERLPTSSETSELARSRSFQEVMPRSWDKPHALEKDFYQRWFERYQVNESFDFAKILLSHSANHANFIDPKFFNDLNGSMIPYSIANSTHVCSSCLEFFNILGSQWPVKYVVPCIGAVQFAKLPMDDYLKVVTLERCKGENMPIYEYRCEKCGQVNEFLILGTQNQLQCEQCGSEDLTKLMSTHNTPSGSSRKSTEPGSGGCCGAPNSCGTPGSCCSG